MRFAVVSFGVVFFAAQAAALEVQAPSRVDAVTVFLSGLPLGWVANPEATAGDTLTLTVRPDGNDPNPFLKRDPKWTPITPILEASADEFRFAFGTIAVRAASVTNDRDE